MKPMFRLLLLAITLPLATMPPAAMANTTAPTSINCYQANIAYVSGAMNIREHPSTTSYVVAKAQAGDSFNVAASIRGEKWCWLNITQGWLANTARVHSTKPQQTTISPTSSTATQTTPANIDNCCFVDRHCTNDHQWEAGYWAYQNNQCGAPVAVVTVVSTPLTPSTATDVNNCCQVGWHCQTEHEWERGFWNYQVGQCEHPGVIMEGSDPFKAIMDAALKLLRDRSPQWYAYTLDGLSKIREVAGDKIRVSSRSGDNRWGSDTGVLRRREIASIAALLAHEACHVHRRRSGQFPTGGVVGETACVQLEIQVLDTLGSYPRRRNWLQYLLDNIHDPAVQWWH